MAAILTTDRLVLRPFEASDADRVVDLVGKFEVSKWLTRVPYPYARDDALAFFDRLPDNNGAFAVTLTGDVIGAVSWLDQLGFWYGLPYWGQGYATEAARAVLARHFDRSNEAVESGYLDGNLGSRKVLEKLGFVPAESRMTPCLSRGCEVLNHRVILTRENWERALQ